MSLILEALKKSEAERRLGQAPGLSTPMPLLRRRDHRRWLPLLAIGLVLAGVVAAALWFWNASRDGHANMIEAPAATTGPATMAPPAAAPTNGSIPAPLAPAPPVAAKRSGSARTGTASPPLPRDPAFDSVERESLPVPARSTPDLPLPPAITAPEPTPSPIATESIPIVDGEILPRFADLSASQRDALPPLKLSMHVFAEDRAARFVLIDGRRHAEGARLSNGLRVEEIRRDGAVLDFNGLRFVLPRP